MNFYKKTSFIVSALIILASFAGCAPKTTTSVAKIENPKVINISYVKAPLKCTLYN